MDRTTPTKPASRKQKLPPNSAFLPRVLAAKFWNESEEEKTVEKQVEEEGIKEEELSGAETATQLFQKLQIALTKATQQISRSAQD